MYDPEFNPYDRIMQLEAYVITLFGLAEELAANNNRNSQNLLQMTHCMKQMALDLKRQQEQIRRLSHHQPYNEMTYGHE